MFDILDLSLLTGPGEQLWVSAISNQGAVNGVPRGDGSLPSLAELGEMTEDFEDGIRFAKPQQGLDVGTALTNLVLGDDEISALFQRTRGVAAANGRQLLVRVLAAPWAVAAVPWELLLDPNGGAHQYLTLAPDAHVVRAARSRTYPASPTPISPPLNLLIILSSPLISTHGDDSLLFDLFEEKRNLLAELRPLEDAGWLNIDVVEHPTLENLRRCIGGRRDGYHLVHYVGHALPGTIILENRFGRSSDITADQFNELLRLCPNLRLALFAGCETASLPGTERTTDPSGSRVDEWRLMLSTADRFVRESCPMVIGMRAVLPFRTEWLFTRFFYQGVATGYTVADAARLARAAIRGDEFVGGQQLDWAVPSLIVGGDPPSQLVDPSISGARHHRAVREDLKLDLVEQDREFFSRLIPLRLAVDVLTGTSRDRVLLVSGPSGVGKTRLIDRALDDIGDRVEFVLYVRADRIVVAPDPVLQLCEWVAELLSRRDGKLRQPQAGWNGATWWERLVGELTTTRFIIVLDDVDQLPDAAGLAIGQALRQIADRRTGCRVALCGASIPASLVAAQTRDQAAEIKLAPFTWDEVWRWIRRNLPALTRFGLAGLAEHYAVLGSQLELWSKLAEMVAAQQGTPHLGPLVAELVPAAGPAASVLTAEATVARPQRSLRLAIPGPHLRSPEGLAIAITRLAAEHKVGGRAHARGPDQTSTLAVLLPLASPFDDFHASASDLVDWLTRATALEPDIVLLDYGSGETPGRDDPQLQLIRALAQRALVIAPAGLERGKVAFPARMPEVLAVGALSDERAIADYSSREPKLQKPELFALGDLSGTPLQDAVIGPDFRGPSAAALRVAAAAALVWATNPEKDAKWVRDVLLRSARRFTPSGYRTYQVRALDEEGVISEARASLIMDALAEGALSFAELLASIGLPAEVTDTTLDRLILEGQLTRAASGSSELYRLV